MQLESGDNYWDLLIHLWLDKNSLSLSEEDSEQMAPKTVAMEVIVFTVPKENQNSSLERLQKWDRLFN